MRGGFYLENTAGENSRQSKITAAQARRIIREFAAGKRGKANAHRFGITPARYNIIGRRNGWKSLGNLRPNN